MITVHHLENSRSQRVLWMLEELGVPYDVIRYQRNKQTMLAPPELLAIHPLGKSPVITDDGMTIAESGAILEYLVEKYGQGAWAPVVGTPEHLKYRYFMHYAEGSLMPILLMKLVTQKLATAPAPFFIRPITRAIAKKLASAIVDGNLARNIAFLGTELDARPWFAGNDISAADVLMSFPLEATVARASGEIPKSLRSFVEKIHARPAFGRALERGGPYDILG